MKSIEKIAFLLIPLSVLISSLTIVPNRILVFSLLLITLIQHKFFLKGLLKNKWFLFPGLIFVLLILLGNPFLSKETILFLTIPLYFIIYRHSSLSFRLQKKYYVLAVFFFSITLLTIKSVKIILFSLNNFLEKEQWWNQLLYKNLSQDIDGHPTYISMFILSSLIILIHEKEFGSSYFSRFQFIFIQVILFLTLFLFAVKISFVVVVFLLLTYLGFIMGRKNKKSIVYTILFLIIASIITYHTPGIKQRMLSDLQSLTTYSPKDKSGNRLKERLALWNSSIQFIEKNPVIGTSFMGVSSKSSIYPNAKEIYPGLNHEKNCHNNYLEFGVRYGLLGMGLFFFLIFLFWKKGIKQNSFEIIGLMILLSFFSFTESFMFREIGISFAAIIISIFGVQYYGKNI